MECIESIEVKSVSGDFERATLVQGLTGKSSSSEGLGITFESRTRWRAGQGEFTVEAFLDSFERPISETQKGAVLRLSIGVGDALNAKEAYRVILRESLLRPMNVQLLVLNAKSTVNQYRDGRRWILEGSPRIISGYLQQDWIEEKVGDSTVRRADFSKRADYDVTQWAFYIHHADYRPGYGYFSDPNRCADKGFSVTSFNAPAAGDPFWDGATKSLNFSIAAPAYLANGERNTGFFRYSTTHEYLDCKFNENSFSSRSELIVEVLAEDGTSKVATTSIINSRSRLEFFAAGFGYSSPKVLLREAKVGEVGARPIDLDEKPVTPSAAPSAKEKSAIASEKSKQKSRLVCVKGNKERKFLASTKKCPKGWKVRS